MREEAVFVLTFPCFITATKHPAVLYNQDDRSARAKQPRLAGPRAGPATARIGGDKFPDDAELARFYL